MKTNENSNTDEEGLEVTSDNLGNIYVTGISDNGTSEQYTTLKYTTFDRQRQPLFDVNGQPDRLDNELVIRFQPDAIIPSVFDNKEITHGTLDEFLTVQALNDIKDAVGFKVSEFQCFKVHPRMTTADTLSLTRTGRWIKILPFYATLVVVVPNSVDEYLFEYDLEQVHQHVQVVDLNHLYTLHNGVNDTYYQNDSSAGLVVTTAIPNANINIEPAWDVAIGDTSVKVGIFDSGINYKHQDFGDGTWAGSVIKNGYDYLNNQSLPITGTALADSTGHGTAVAGIIGAIRNNNFGIAGIAGGDDAQNIRGVELHDMKLTNVLYDACSDNFSDNSTIQSAIIEGCSNNPSTGFGFAQDIQNHSWGGGYSEILEDAIRTAFQHGTILIASSGNRAIQGQCDNYISYPASFKDEWVIKTGANNSTGLRADFSNCGYDIDVIAPGTNDLYQSLDNNVNNGFTDSLIYSPTFGINCAAKIDGTSFAAPHVSGTAALMVSYINQNPWSPNTVVQEDCEMIISKYATDANMNVLPNYDDEIGHGRLNAGKVLKHIEAPKYRIEHHNFTSNSYNVTPSGSGWVWIDGIWNGTTGYKQVNRYKITATNYHVTYLNLFPIDAWKRDMESELFDIPLAATQNDVVQSINFIPYKNVDVSLDSYDKYHTTMSGYIYEIINFNSQGQPNHKWFPFDTTSTIEFAYSLHLLDSIIISTKEEFIENNTLEVYPQPASDLVIINLNNIPNEDIKIDLFDVTGKYIKTIYKGVITNEKEKLSFNVSSLSSGIYIIHLVSDKGIVSKKLIIQH